MTCVPWSFHSSVLISLSLLSVGGARARHVLLLLPAHGVARLRPAAVVRAVRDPVAALRAAVHAIASRQKHSRALLAGR
jgi:hypothetical protein